MSVGWCLLDSAMSAAAFAVLIVLCSGAALGLAAYAGYKLREALLLQWAAEARGDFDDSEPDDLQPVGAADEGDRNVILVRGESHDGAAAGLDVAEPPASADASPAVALALGTPISNTGATDFAPAMGVGASPDPATPSALPASPPPTASNTDTDPEISLAGPAPAGDEASTELEDVDVDVDVESLAE